MDVRPRNKDEIVVKCPDTGDILVIDTETGAVVSRPDYDPKSYRYTHELALLVCDAIARGKTWKQIDKDPNLPPLTVIRHWQRRYPLFKEELLEARKHKAEMLVADIEDLADQAMHGSFDGRDEIAQAKLAIDTKMKLAEKYSPQSYGSKVVHEGNAEKPIVMRVINTGINRAKPDIVITNEEQFDGRQISEAEEGEQTGSSEDAGREQRLSLDSDRSEREGFETGVRSEKGQTSE